MSTQFIKLHEEDGDLYIKPENIVAVRTTFDSKNQICDLEVEVEDGTYSFDGEFARSNYSILLPFIQ